MYKKIIKDGVQNNNSDYQKTSAVVDKTLKEFERYVNLCIGNSKALSVIIKNVQKGKIERLEDLTNGGTKDGKKLSEESKAILTDLLMIYRRFFTAEGLKAEFQRLEKELLNKETRLLIVRDKSGLLKKNAENVFTLLVGIVTFSGKEKELIGIIKEHKKDFFGPVKVSAEKKADKDVGIVLENFLKGHIPDADKVEESIAGILGLADFKGLIRDFINTIAVKKLGDRANIEIEFKQTLKKLDFKEEKEEFLRQLSRKLADADNSNIIVIIKELVRSEQEKYIKN